MRKAGLLILAVALLTGMGCATFRKGSSAPELKAKMDGAYSRWRTPFLPTPCWAISRTLRPNDSTCLPGFRILNHLVGPPCRRERSASS